MNYFKGLAVAAAIDLAWIMACPATATAPEPLLPADAVAEWPAETPVAVPGLRDVDYVALSELEDSLIVYLQEHPDDVDAVQRVAGFYMEHGWYESAIGPLARAIQLDAERWSLWVALDKALEKSAIGKISDAELIRRAAAFVEAVNMWGHGC